jgi:sulfatase modifying factor 1
MVEPPKRAPQAGFSRPPEKPTRHQVWLCPADGLEYIFLPAGSFLMGASPSDLDATEVEKPRHVVEVTKGHWLARTPVTVAAYRRFCEQTKRPMAEAPEFNPRWGWKTHPIVNVRWHDAAAYCQWIGGRLPTEAEWERAARAGVQTRFWWGDEFDTNQLWFQGNAGGHTRQVATKSPNQWGFFDLLGNVWEWCADCYHDGFYASSPTEDPLGPAPGANRVLRGGSWDSVATNLRVSTRMRYGPALLTSFVGFRALIEA